MIGRLGGDEFVAILTDTNEEKVALILQRFKLEILAMNKAINKPYIIEYSAGVANFSSDVDLSLEKMIEQADSAMYKKKEK